MSNIRLSDLSKLIKVTGAGIMECKNALTDSNGDFDLAMEILKNKGKGSKTDKQWDKNLEQRKMFVGVEKEPGQSKRYIYKYPDNEISRIISSESPEKYERRITLAEIKRKVSKLSIKYKGIEYDSDKISKMGEEIDEREKSKEEREKSKSNKVPDILVTQELSDEVKKELNYWKTKNTASGWKSRQRSLREKGKLEQHKIDSLNKLGMLWNSKEDKWEKKYIRFRTHGLCNEIEIWVKKQRKLYENNELSNENLYRLQAANFPFTPLPNETFKFTRKSLWELVTKLDRKKARFELEQQKLNRVFSNQTQEKETKINQEREKRKRKTV